MNLRVPENAGIYRVAAQLVASLVVLSSTELALVIALEPYPEDQLASHSVDFPWP
jgi:hypothetical protein